MIITIIIIIIITITMDQFMAQYGTASFDKMVEASEGGTSSITSGTLVEQMRKQAYLNQQQRDQEDEDDAEWEAFAAMQAAEDQNIHERLLNGAQPSSSSNGDPAAEAKANALANYRAAESAIREAATQGEDVDAQTRLAYMAAENQVATEQSIKWRDRGPRGEGAPTFFKGQKWRASSQRYASRGGTRQAEFAAIHSGQKAKKGGGTNSKGVSHDDKGGGDSNRKGCNKGSKEGGSKSKGCNKGSKEGGSKSQGGKKGSKADDSQDQPTRMQLALGYCPTCNSLHCRFLVYISIFLYLLGFLVYNPLASSGDNTNSKYE